MNSNPPAILIVDDSPQNLQIAGETLSHSLPCELSFATDGNMAWDAIREEKPDLILLDIMMPGLGGLDLCRRLKADGETQKIPVIFLTARNDPQDIAAGFEAGGYDYVVKPFKQLELVARVSACLELQKATRTIEAQNEELQHLLRILCHDLANPIGGIHGLLKVCDQDTSLLEECLPDLRVMTGQAMDQIDLVRKMHSLENQRYNLPLVSVQVGNALKEAEQSLHQKLRAKELRMHFDVPEDLFVQVEPTSFVSSVLANFLSNAIKFSFRHGEISIHAERQEAGWVKIEIRDSGVGIPAEKISHVFEPTALYSTLGTEGEKGTGFGMPLAKKFVEAYGGNLQIASRSQKAYPEDSGTLISMVLMEGDA